MEKGLKNFDLLEHKKKQVNRKEISRDTNAGFMIHFIALYKNV